MLYVILGIIQGLTEFLPVSSSGHLVLFSWFSGIQESEILPIIIVCHLGTIIAIICFFFKDIIRVFNDLVTIMHIVIVTLVTGIIALIGRNFFEQLFLKPVFVCFSLLVTSVILILSRRFTKARREMFSLNMKDAFWLGICQGIAIIPGISRSGFTIFSLLARNVSPETAFKFSFIAGIPAMLGSFILESGDIITLYNNNAMNFWTAFLASFIFGILGLLLLRLFVKRLQLHYFAYYLIVVSIVCLIVVK